MIRHIVFLLFILLLLFSCRKEKEGCLSGSAYNYDPTVEKDDGSCYYGEEVWFWSKYSGGFIEVWLNGEIWKGEITKETEWEREVIKDYVGTVTDCDYHSEWMFKEYAACFGRTPGQYDYFTIISIWVDGIGYIDDTTRGTINVVEGCNLIELSLP